MNTLNLLKQLSMTTLGVGLIAICANSASAITVTKGGTAVAGEGYYSSQYGATTINFNDGVLPSGFATYSGGAIVQGSLVGDHAAPAGDASPYLTANSPQVGGTTPVTINFAKAIDYFGLYWGSIDTYNSIKFYNGGNLLKTFTGSDVSSVPNGSWTDPNANSYLNFFGAGESFDKIELISSGIAFESDNHAYRVPEPSAMIGLFALGTLGLGSALKRKEQ
jgi:PEP-CTERM motif